MKEDERTILRADRSPMNRKIWIYELSCGHEVYKAGRKLTKKQMLCEQCETKRKAENND